MGNKESYERLRDALLNDKSINPHNRKLFKEFFKEEEYKLKRSNGLRHLDDKNYKTLKEYPNRLKIVNGWLKNKTWDSKVKGSFTKADFQKVYDGIEDGKLLGARGKPIVDKGNFYYKIFLSTPFLMAGKKAMAQEVMRFVSTPPKPEVEFITEEDFRKAVGLVIQPKHKLALWLGFDIGENMTSILLLTKRDCKKQYDNEHKSHEYLINLRKLILKRTRTPRTEPTIFDETVALLDIILEGKDEDDLLFDFGQKATEKVWRRAVRLSKIKCEPNGATPCLKHLRKGMACNLLKKGWTRDEVNARLGHKPSSKTLDAYVTYLALDKKKPKVKLQQSKISDLEREIEEMREREKLNQARVERLTETLAKIQEKFKQIERAT